MSTLYQLWRLENTLEKGERYLEHDRLYVPMLAYTTGDLDVHDIAVDRNANPIFVNTLFGCLARPSDRYSFLPVWKPPFLSRLAAEDRCHLNGLALVDGEPRYATAVSESDVADGWREHRRSGGVLIDIAADAVIARGLSMPHSPRWYRGRLWVLDSGSGRFGYVDPADGRFEEVAFCPGYLRGMAFIGDFAVLGLSNCRENRTFQGLALEEALALRKALPRCGVQVVDLRSGDVVHWLRIEGVVRELYDVVVLPDVQRPMALGLKNDEIRRHVRVGPDA